ncbi:PREDICTED: melanoma inhibitory activity protein 2 [Nanorana parkeri]|uniref:melanoma inhibitory activity protein 2 n=1 Tax=Nanorana parkeri TaxID=125878 RepID=UPI000854E7DC|nr:PREDICTED: melanoma inhibitory activity protein 2 [Nanorana parkeri]
MAGVRLYRVAFLIGVIAVLQILSQKILSSKKRCGDPQCESLMMRVSAKQDYTGPDCRFLSFKAGWEINVYYKLAEGREDLWQGSTGKAYGFFPRDIVNVEEVYLSEEVEVPAKEIDFVCLDGGEYFFENEDSVLHSSREHEEDFMEHTGGGISTEDLQEDINLKEPAQEVTDKPPWAPSGIAGWFGMGGTQDKQDNTDNAEHIEEEGPAEPMLENNGEQPKEAEDSQPENAGWFGGRLKGLLPFGGKDKQDDTEASIDTSQSASEESVVETEKENTSSNPQDVEQDNRETKNIEEAKAKWFNFAIKDVLSFGAKNEKKKGESEDPSQSVDETESSEIPRQMDLSQGNSTEGDAEHKTDTSVEDPPTMEETKHDTELKLDINIEHTTVYNDKSESDGSKVGNTDVVFEALDQQELNRIPDKENNIKFQENPEVPKPLKTNHEPTHWFKSVVSNVTDLGKSDRDQGETEQAKFGEINHDNGLSDTTLYTPNNNHSPISGETEPSREGIVTTNTDEHDQDINSDELSDNEIANESERTLKDNIVTQLNNDPAIPIVRYQK